MTRSSRNLALSREGRRGLLAIVGIIILFAAMASMPYFWNAALAAQLAETRQELALIEGKTRDTARRKGASLTSADDISAVFLAGNTAGVALAELQQLAGTLAEQSGLVVERTQPLPAEVKDGLAIFRLEIETSGPIEGLRGYLHALETGTPLIFVRRANLSIGQAEEESIQSLPSERLSARLELEAFGWWEPAQ